jgi:hypothetical protein
MSDIISNLDSFFRKMRLKSFFHIDPDLQGPTMDDLGLSQSDLESTNNPKWKAFKPKSTFNPPPQEDTLEAFCKQVKHKVLQTPIRKVRWSNMSKQERSGLNDLKNIPEITIKKADKGSAIVVMNTCDYIFEAERQLNNKLAYKKLDFDPSKQVCKEIQNILDLMLEHNEIDQKCHEYLSPIDPRPGRFYLLPKIHKKGCPGRPICSSNGHPTERISRFVDAHIRKFMYKQKSYVRDTQDFIQKIKEIGPIPHGTILATLDVTSLYTNIPKIGRASCRERV